METPEELIKAYTKEICTNCKHRKEDNDMCSIAMVYKEATARCCNYEKEINK